MSDSGESLEDGVISQRSRVISRVSHAQKYDTWAQNRSRECYPFYREVAFHFRKQAREMLND